MKEMSSLSFLPLICSFPLSPPPIFESYFISYQIDLVTKQIYQLDLVGAHEKDQMFQTHSTSARPFLLHFLCAFVCLYPLFGPYVLFHLSLIFHILNITCASSSGLEDLALLKTSVTNTKYQCLSCLLVQSGNVGIIWLLIQEASVFCQIRSKTWKHDS